MVGISRGWNKPQADIHLAGAGGIQSPLAESHPGPLRGKGDLVTQPRGVSASGTQPLLPEFYALFLQAPGETCPGHSDLH